MLAVDVSNYTGQLSQANLAAWKARGVDLVIVQAFPMSYATKYWNQRQQMDACQAAGMPFNNYIYDYLHDPTWRDGCLAGLEGVPLKPAYVWADEEDTTASNMPLTKRVSAVAATLTKIAAAGYQAGVYTGRWFWVGYMGNTTAFKSYPLWDANYDGVPDPDLGFVPYGGWTHPTIKQYQGTTTLDGVGNVDLDAV